MDLYKDVPLTKQLLTDLQENLGAKAWQKGYAFWQVPEFTAKKWAKAWQRGYDRAEAEFGNIHNGQPGRWEWRPRHGYVGDK